MTVRIVPAVDIRGGRCVNLVQGDYGRETVFSEDPVAQALAWWRDLADAGTDPASAMVHVVDLDGARGGRCCVLDELRALAREGVRFEVGGGLRSLDTISTVLDAGAALVILGTAAFRDPELLQAACAAHPGRIAVGIDAREGKVSLSGWMEDTDADAEAFARTAAASGAARIIYTDILSDGMMKGPNHAATGAVARAAGVPVTLSGGVSSLDDLRKARELAADGVDEAIVGRALYLGRFTIAEAVAALGRDG